MSFYCAKLSFTEVQAGRIDAGKGFLGRSFDEEKIQNMEYLKMDRVWGFGIGSCILFGSGNRKSNLQQDS